MKTRISQLMDGELDGREADDMIAAAGCGGEAADAWRTYHLIGDAMRGARLTSGGFGERVAERLAAEPTVLAPAPRRAEPRAWLAMAASVAAVALVAWVAFGPLPEPALAPIAVAPAPVLQQATPAPLAVATPIPYEVNDYLLAHQAYSPRGSLQGMAPYVRSVSSER